MIHVFADGSFHRRQRRQPWAVLAILPDRSTHLQKGRVKARRSTDVEEHAFRQATRLAEQLVDQHDLPATVYTDHEVLLTTVEDTRWLRFMWVPRHENRAHHHAYEPNRPVRHERRPWWRWSTPK